MIKCVKWNALERAAIESESLVHVSNLRLVVS